MNGEGAYSTSDLDKILNIQYIHCSDSNPIARTMITLRLAILLSLRFVMSSE